ncbi:retrotransposon protein [Tanacetum coccineum]
MDSKIYEIVLDNDGIASKITTKEKVKSLALKAKVTREQTSDDSDSQEESDEDVDEEEAKAFNFLARNFCKFFRKGNRFRHGNRFGNDANKFGKGRGNSFGNKGGESLKPKGACYNCKIEGHFANECRKPKENKAFIGGAWSDSEDGDGQLNDKTYLMAIDSQEAYDGGHVVFGSNLKGKVVGGGNITHDSIKITNVEHVSGLAFNLISVGQLCDDDFLVNFTKVDCAISKNGKKLSKDTGQSNMRLVQNTASNKLVRNLPMLSFERHFCDTCGLGSQGYSQTSKAYIVLNKETMRIEESVNVTFEESLPEPKSSYSVEDDRIDEPIVQDLNGSLQVNVSDEGYP